jgi:hypothetical protein
MSSLYSQMAKDLRTWLRVRQILVVMICTDRRDLGLGKSDSRGRFATWCLLWRWETGCQTGMKGDTFVCADGRTGGWQVFAKMGSHVDYRVGTMIEVPRGALQVKLRALPRVITGSFLTLLAF